MRSFLALSGIVLLAATACDGGGVGSADREDSRPWWEQEGLPPPSHVDSILPAGESLRRFREGLEEATGLSGGSASRAELVDRFIQALVAADTTALASLAIDRAEFAWLYYPHSIYVAPPYELPPDVVWLQHQNYSSRGLRRLLEQYGGKTLHYTGHRCTPEEGESLGRGRQWAECLVLGELPTGEKSEERLFAGILEIGGRFKLLSFGNEL
jgi:hypothetical protein